MIKILMILALFAQQESEQQPLTGPLLDRIAKRIEESEKKIEAERQAMQGVLSDWRQSIKDERKKRQEAAAEERKLIREQFEFERKKRKEAWSKQSEEIKRNFTPIKGLVERLEALMISLRKFLWQAGLTIAGVVFVSLLLFSGIRWAWDKFLANVVGYPFKWIFSQLTGVK